MSKLVYLAGPITGLSYNGATDWREYTRQQFTDGVTGLSPMRAKDYLSTHSRIGDSYPNHVMSSAKGILARDSFDVRRSDMILVNLLGATEISKGTVMEIGMAHALNIPYVLIEEENNPHNHSMINEGAGWIVRSLDEGIHIVNATLGVD